MRFSALFAVLASVVAVVAQDPVSVDDSDGSIAYASPRGSWTRHQNQASSFGLYQNTDTFTDVQGATITWKFRGTHVEYWGNTGSYHGPCRVTIDGGNDETVSSNAAQTGPPILLYQRSDLDPAVEHTIVITIVDDSFPNVCELDRFIYIPVDTTDTTPTPTPTSTRPSSTPPTSNGGGSSSGGSGNNSSANSTKSSPPWGIIGGAVGGGLGGGILLAVALYWWCRRQKKREDIEHIVEQQPTIPVIAQSKPQPPFAPRPLSNEQSVYSNKAQMAASTRPPSTAYTTSMYPASAATTDGQFHPASLMPVAYPDGRTSTYGSESSYGPTSPALSTHSSRPLMPHNPTQSSTGSAGPYGNGGGSSAPAPATMPLVPGRRPAVLSATSEFGEAATLGGAGVAAAAAGSSSTQAPPRDEKRTVLSAESETGASSSARPLVQHTDAGVVPTPAPAAAKPEELPPAYNDQWSGQQR